MGCDDPLTVDDPLTILEERVNNPVGADLLRRNARAALSRFTGETAWESGLITDEFFYQQDAGTDIQIFPFDNQQLRYRRTKIGVDIYSIGADGQDDNANIDNARRHETGVDLGFRLWNVEMRRQPPMPFVVIPEVKK